MNEPTDGNRSQQSMTDGTQLTDKLKDLLGEFGEILPDSKSSGNTGQTKTVLYARKLQEQVDLFDYLRVCIKYQTFDLEATRRENEYLRKLLEEERQ